MPKLRPKNGWFVDSVRDLKELGQYGEIRCDCCRPKPRLRFVHVLYHPDYDRTVNAGSCCAVRLVYGYDAEGVEKAMRQKCSRRRQFIDASRWRPSTTNSANVVRNVTIGRGKRRKTLHRVTIALRYGLYRVTIYRAADDRWIDLPGMFETRAEAKVAAFEWVDSRKQKAQKNDQQRTR